MTEYVRVPREPTEAMIEAANSAAMAFAGGDLSDADMIRLVWSAMRAASPQEAVLDGRLHDGIRQLKQHISTMSAEELAAMDAKIVADTIAEMQRQIEQLTGARHSMYDPAVVIARDIALRTPPAMSADHIGDAQGWRDIATAPRDGTAFLACLEGYDDLHEVVSWNAENSAAPFATADGPSFMVGRFSHWQPLPPPPSADTKRSEPDALPGDMRDDILERLRALDFAGHYDEARFQYIADAILAIIQTERAG